MPYIPPEEVLSPRSQVRGVIEVIHDPGEDGMSVARIQWGVAVADGRADLLA